MAEARYHFRAKSSEFPAAHQSPFKNVFVMERGLLERYFTRSLHRVEVEHPTFEESLKLRATGVLSAAAAPSAQVMQTAPDDDIAATTSLVQPDNASSTQPPSPPPPSRPGRMSRLAAILSPRRLFRK